MSNTSTPVTSPVRKSRALAVARVGIMIAIIAVCAWVVVPYGPVPFTLQTFALTLALCVLPPREAVAVAIGYVLVGALGLPVFSGFRGGFGVLMGYTGGYIMGYIVAMVLASLMLHFARRSVESDMRRRRERNIDASSKLYALVNIGYMVLAGLIFSIVTDTVGTIWYVQVASVGWETAFMVCIAPFIIPDVIKIIAAVACAQALNRALNIR
jgi:biotin transport system substrate-specific component